MPPEPAVPAPVTDRSRRAIIAGLMVYAAAAPTLAAAIFMSSRHAGVSIREGILWQGLIYFSLAAVVPVISWTGRRFSAARASWTAPLPVYALMSVPIIFGHGALAAYLDGVFAPSAAGGAPFVDALVARLPLELLFYWSIVAVVYAYDYNARLRQQESAAAQARADLAGAQLRMLKMQMQPHFLFNALQNIAALIPQQPDRASAMTIRLGDLLRLTLGRATTEYVSLQQEIELVRSFLDIEQIRFGMRLEVSYAIDAEVRECQVPDMLLQPIVENALKHGLGPQVGPLLLSIAACRRYDRMVIEVEDNGVGLKAPSAIRFGIGLGATTERLQRLYADRASLRLAPSASGGTCVTIQLPVVGP